MFGRRDHLKECRDRLRHDLETYKSTRDRAQAALIEARLSMQYNLALKLRMVEQIEHIQIELGVLEGLMNEVPQVSSPDRSTGDSGSP